VLQTRLITPLVNNNYYFINIVFLKYYIDYYNKLSIINFICNNIFLIYTNMVDYSDLISTNIFAIPLLFDTIVFFILYCKKQGLKRDKVIIDLIMLIFLLHTFNYCWDLIQFNCLTQNTEGNFPTFISVLTEQNEQNDSGFLDFVLKSFEFFTKFNLHYKQLLKTTYSMYFFYCYSNFFVSFPETDTYWKR
jgi:hypothetical protein